MTRKVRLMRAFWRLANPLVMSWARHTSVWGVLATTGRKTGMTRSAPVAIGVDGRTVWLVAAQGASAHYVRNLVANPSVTITIKGAPRAGTATLLPEGTPLPPALGWYARSATRLWPAEWRLVRIDLG